MRVLVCGGREFGKAMEERSLLEDVLHFVLGRQRHRGTIVHGAARGADALAAEWAEIHCWQAAAFPALWDVHGNAAGAIRNQRMLDEGRPDIVIAFPGGRGTADMVRRARKAGVPVLRVEP